MADVQERQEQRQRQSGAEQDAGKQNGGKPADPRRRRTIRFILLAILVIAAIVAIPVYAYYSVRESTDDAQVDGHVVPIAARINGTILSVLVNNNQEVKKDKKLVRLHPENNEVTQTQAKKQM